MNKPAPSGAAQQWGRGHEGGESLGAPSPVEVPDPLLEHHRPGPENEAQEVRAQGLWLVYIPVLLPLNAVIFPLQTSEQNKLIFNSSPIQAKSSAKPPTCVSSPSRASLETQAT